MNKKLNQDDEIATPTTKKQVQYQPVQQHQATYYQVQNQQQIYRPCVIGVIGDSSQGKHLFLNKLSDKVIFHEVAIQYNKCSPDESIKIEIYNDQLNNNIYINLNSFHDTYILIEIWNKIENMNTNEIEKWLEEAEFIYFKSLLFLFHICNIVFLVIENLTIKSEYFLIFRILKHLKNVISPTINSLLISQLKLQEPFTMMTPGKSVPILQVFLIRDLSEGYSLDSHLKLEDSLKKQTTAMLKNNNIYTTLSSYLSRRPVSNTIQPGSLPLPQQLQQEPLFLIETNRPLVRLIRLYQINSSTINSLFQQIRTKNYSTPFNKQFAYYSQLIQSYESNQHNIPMACINSYKQFLAINKFLPFEYSQWEQVVNILTSQVFDKKELFNLSISISGGGSSNNTIMNINSQFSAKLCNSQFSFALEQYQDGLPSLYGSKVHNSRLNKAIKCLCLSSSGPAIENTIQHLKEECEKIWRKGRKICEKESFTGRLCTLNSHIVPPITSQLSLIIPTSTGPNTNTPISTSGSSNSIPIIVSINTPGTPTRTNSTTLELETRPHSSGYRTRSSCNCGKSTRLREDIFDIELGNSLFYQQACCDEYKSIPIESTKITYLPYKSFDKVEYQTPFSWFAITDYGPNFTIDNADGFYVNDPTLQLWEMKRIFTFGGSNTSSKHTKPNQNYPIGKLSFEYQCPTGHKFIEKKRTRKLFVSFGDKSNNNNRENAHVFFQRLMLESCIHQDCSYYSQLTKVYIQSSLSLSINSTVEISQFDKQPSDKWSYQMDKYASLSKNHYYSIRLPFIFDFNKVPIQLSTQQSSTFLLDILININNFNSINSD